MKGSKHLYFHNNISVPGSLFQDVALVWLHPQVIPTLPLNQLTVKFFFYESFQAYGSLRLPHFHASGCPGFKLHTSAIAVILCRFETQTTHLLSKEFHCKKWKALHMRGLFSNAVHGKGERSSPPIAKQGLSTANLRNSHAIWAQFWNPPSPSISGTEPIPRNFIIISVPPAPSITAHCNHLTV